MVKEVMYYAGPNPSTTGDSAMTFCLLEIADRPMCWKETHTLSAKLKQSRGNEKEREGANLLDQTSRDRGRNYRAQCPTDADKAE